MAMPRPSMVPTGPTGAATVSPVNAGMQAQGRIVAGLGLHMLTKSLPMLGATSEEGLAVAKAVASLGARFGKPPADMGRAAMDSMRATMEPAPKVPEDQARAFTQQARPAMGAA